MLRAAPRPSGRPRQLVRAHGAALRRTQTRVLRSPCAPLMLRSFAVPRASFSTESAPPKPSTPPSRKKNHGIPTLKGQLKKFYKLVHPDLFAAHPDARAANEAALTRLMGVADRFNKQPGGNPFAPPEGHQFTFYVMKKENQKINIPTGEIPGGRVTITEVEGQPLLRVHFETKINQAYELTRAAFGRLFESLGIDPEFVLDEPDERVFPPSIEEFFRSYIGHARHKKETYEAQVREEVGLVKEIENKSGADVVNLPDVTEAPLEDRLHVLRAFLGVLPKIASVSLLQGQAIAFQAPFTGTYYDREQQVICFDPLADPTQWASFIDLKLTLPQYTNYLRPKREKDQPRAAASFLERMERIKRKTSEVGGAAKRREMSTERKLAEKQEKQLAAALALKSVGFPLKDLNRNNTNEEEEENEEDTDDLYSSNSSKEMQAYRSFLDRFVKPPALQEMQKYLQVNSKRAKAFKNAAIFVREFTLPKRWSVSPEGGLYVASSLSRPSELIATLEEAGPLASAAAAEARKREELRHFVRTRLGLHGMATHRMVFATETDAANKMRTALERLASAADSLRELNLRGQTVVVSHKYAISDDGMLFIPWNFQFEPKEPKRIAKDADAKKEGEESKSTKEGK